MGNFRKIAVLSVSAFLFTLIFCCEAEASIFGTFAGRATTFAKGFQNLAFCMAGFGIVMFTWMAIFGKINFKHLGYIFICLFLLSGTGLFISYITGKKIANLSGYATGETFVKGAHDTIQKAAPDDGPAERNTSM